MTDSAPPVRPLRLARAVAAAALLALPVAAAAQAPLGQPPAKDDKKDKKEKAPTPDEQKAREAFNAGKLDEALKILQAAAKGNPTAVPPKVRLSRWFLEVKEGSAARQMLEQAATEDPAHPEVLLTNASYALNEGRITDAILSLEAALTAARASRWDAEASKQFERQARLGLVYALERRSNWTAIKEHLAALLKNDPNNPQLRTSLARANFLLGHPEEAFSDLQAAYKADPTLDPPELGMAVLWSQKPDAAKAEDWFGKAATAYPKSAKVHREYALFLLSRGKADAAKGHVDAAQRLDPNSRETQALIGLLARYNKQMNVAEKVFEGLVQQHPTFGFATSNLALVLAESGDANQRRRAVELAQVFVNQNPRSSDAYGVLAYCLYKDKRIDDAEKAATVARSAGSVTPDTAYFIARVLNEKGKVEEAHKVLKEAVGSQGGFVYRKDAEALLADLEKRLPKEKK